MADLEGDNSQQLQARVDSADAKMEENLVERAFLYLQEISWMLKERFGIA